MIIQTVFHKYTVRFYQCSVLIWRTFCGFPLFLHNDSFTKATTTSTHSPTHQTCSSSFLLHLLLLLLLLVLFCAINPLKYIQRFNVSNNTI